MLESDKVFAGSIPESYDRYMVPLIFGPVRCRYRTTRSVPRTGRFGNRRGERRGSGLKWPDFV